MGQKVVAKAGDDVPMTWEGELCASPVASFFLCHCELLLFLEMQKCHQCQCLVIDRAWHCQDSFGSMQARVLLLFAFVFVVPFPVLMSFFIFRIASFKMLDLSENKFKHWGAELAVPKDSKLLDFNNSELVVGVGLKHKEPAPADHNAVEKLFTK